MLLLVRHGHAGSRDRWRGDDGLRPLTERGVEEAAALVNLLAPYAPRRIVSSPLVRCVQTVQPLATYLGCAIEVAAQLGPAAGERAAAFVRQVSREKGPIVLCTHGETIESLQAHLDGARSSGFKPGSAHEKGSVWILRTRGGKLTSAEYLPPRVETDLAPSAFDH